MKANPRNLMLGLMIPGIALTGIILASYGYLALSPVSRRHLDRVSFRLLVYALVAHMVFGATVLVMTLHVYRDWSCSLLSFITNSALQFSGGMFFCVALNLPLVLAHGINGQKTEKYYVLGTAFVCAVCNGVAYAGGALGWNSSEHVCWYRNRNPAKTLRWVVGTQTFWIFLVSAGEIVAFLSIVWYLFRYTHIVRPVYPRSSPYLSRSKSRSDAAGSTIFMYRGTILRIAIYPLMSALMNMTGALFDLYVVQHPILVKHNAGLDIADLAMFSIRPLAYGLLAATDPSFINAVNALRRGEVSSTDADSPPSAVLSTVIDMRDSSSTVQSDVYMNMDTLSIKSNARTSVVEAMPVLNAVPAPVPIHSVVLGGAIESLPRQSMEPAQRDVARHI
ncbi:hypothetical protein FB45DRAFT_934945 [Roridomyces roridus]|uniref:Uncharacterized protein n=1 Tax=Roridomyces roridus TaxID=1738132 RepID=A0AAD7BB96_9AGAR|nr:hypothetical protein FB45DRAFT_934945 [Roridomyces roridus]